jgi:hypothetical protein
MTIILADSAASIFRIEQFSALKMEAAGSPEMLVSMCQTTWCHTPEDNDLHFCYGLLTFTNTSVLCLHIYTVFIMQACQTSQYVVPRGGIFLGKWRSSFAEVPTVK